MQLWGFLCYIFLFCLKGGCHWQKAVRFHIFGGCAKQWRPMPLLSPRQRFKSSMGFWHVCIDGWKAHAMHDCVIYVVFLPLMAIQLTIPKKINKPQVWGLEVNPLHESPMLNFVDAKHYDPSWGCVENKKKSDKAHKWGHNASGEFT